MFFLLKKERATKCPPFLKGSLAKHQHLTMLNCKGKHIEFF